MSKKDQLLVKMKKDADEKEGDLRLKDYWIMDMEQEVKWKDDELQI